LRCTLNVSDPRVSGTGPVIVDCTFTDDGETTVGQCTGTNAMSSDGGSWEGTFSGTTSWSTSEPDHLHVLDITYLGSGGYDGLRLVGTLTGYDWPWTFVGRIEPAD
jgi:hypothetical protein